MSILKWALAGLFIIGIYLLLILFSPFKSIDEVQHGALLDSGSFAIQVQGSILGQETFELRRSGSGYSLSSEVAIEFQGQHINISQTTSINDQWEVTYYEVERDSYLGSSSIAVSFEGDVARIVTSSNDVEQSYERIGVAPLIPIDNNVTSHFYLLYRIISKKIAEGEIFEGTAIHPVSAASFPTRVNSIKTATLEIANQTISVTRYEIQMGDIPFALLGNGETLLVIDYMGQESMAFRSDLLAEAPVIALAEADAEVLPIGVNETGMEFDSDGLSLQGTLTWSSEEIPNSPVVLMIHGSGPVDRNENGGGLNTNVFRDIAHRLSKAGIPSFRYDKRGVGESEGVFTDASMQDLIGDAGAAIETLRNDERYGSNPIVLLGHSEGAMLAPMLANQYDIAGLILMAGAYHPLDWILIEQTRLIFNASGASAETTVARVGRTNQFIEFVKSSAGGWDEYTFEQIKEYVPELTEQEFAAQKQGMSLEWYREHFAHDPGETIKQIRVPVLILQGDKDIQIPKEEATRLANALSGEGNSEVTLHILEDLNHLMRYHPEEPNIQYRHLDEPVDLRVLTIIENWLLGL